MGALIGILGPLFPSATLKEALLKGDKYVDDISGQKHVVMGEWIQPYLPYIDEGEAIDR